MNTEARLMTPLLIKSLYPTDLGSFKNVPDELLKTVSGYIRPSDIPAFKQVCKSFDQAALETVKRIQDIIEKNNFIIKICSSSLNSEDSISVPITTDGDFLTELLSGLFIPENANLSLQKVFEISLRNLHFLSEVFDNKDIENCKKLFLAFDCNIPNELRFEIGSSTSENIKLLKEIENKTKDEIREILEELIKDKKFMMAHKILEFQTDELLDLRRQVLIFAKDQELMLKDVVIETDSRSAWNCSRLSMGIPLLIAGILSVIPLISRNDRTPNLGTFYILSPIQILLGLICLSATYTTKAIGQKILNRCKIHCPSSSQLAQIIFAAGAMINAVIGSHGIYVSKMRYSGQEYDKFIQIYDKCACWMLSPYPSPDCQEALGYRVKNYSYPYMEILCKEIMEDKSNANIFSSMGFIGMIMLVSFVAMGIYFHCTRKK